MYEDLNTGESKEKKINTEKDKNLKPADRPYDWDVTAAIFDEVERDEEYKKSDGPPIH